MARVSFAPKRSLLYRYTADYDKKYAFDIERFLSHRLKLKPDDAVEVYQADLSGEPVA